MLPLSANLQPEVQATLANAVAMQPPMLMAGLLSHARGSCPVCGTDVQRDHSFNGVRLVDTYACYRCGPTEYRVKVRPAVG